MSFRSFNVTSLIPKSFELARPSFCRPIERSSYSVQARHIHQTPNRVIFSGIQPTGVPHIGNYLGALQQWVRLQRDEPATTRFIFSIVDLHAVTVQQDAEQLRKWKKETLAALLAVGLDPERCTIFYQSDVRAELSPQGMQNRSFEPPIRSPNMRSSCGY